MVIDVGYLVYSVLIVYAVIGTLVAGLVALGAWRLSVYLKELTDKGTESGESRQAVGHPKLAHPGVQVQ